MIKTKRYLAFAFCFLVLCFGIVQDAFAIDVNASYDLSTLPDMSDFDPNLPLKPDGDTIKIAIISSFTGPGAVTGEAFYLYTSWAAHDINKRGGILVDGKKKKIELIKADNQSRPDVTKKITERMILKEKVDILWGTQMSHLTQIVSQLANRYKKIHVNATSVSDSLMEGKNYSKYSFMTSYSTQQIGRAAAYYYGQIRKKETKFYILCQDYVFGRSIADAFKEGLKEYYPEAQMVGEDYHQVFLTDFAPYLTKIKASGAEVIFTGDWMPDAFNLLKQSRQMGIMLPFANIFINDPISLEELGIENGEGLVLISPAGTGNPIFKNQGFINYYKAWNNQWKTKFKPPYNTIRYSHIFGNPALYAYSIYWTASVIERAKTLDPEKIISVWEGDSYQYPNGKTVSMRACDHKAVTDLHAIEFVKPEDQKQCFNIPPYYFYNTSAAGGPVFEIPSEKILPKADPELCK